MGVTDLAQDIRVGFYDGVAPGIVALDGGVHQPQAKAHIQHIPTPTTNRLRIQKKVVSSTKAMLQVSWLTALSCTGNSASDSPQGSHINMSVTNEGQEKEKKRKDDADRAFNIEKLEMIPYWAQASLSFSGIK